MSGKSMVPVAIVVALGVLIAAIVFSQRDSRPGTPDSVPIITLVEQVPRIMAEVEHSEIDGPVMVVDDPAASGGKSVEIPEGPNATELNPKLCAVGGTPAPGKAVEDGKFAGQPLHPNGIIRIPFDVTTAGEYVLWVRAYWLHGCANSFYFLVDPAEDPVDKDGDGSYNDDVIPMAFDGGGTYKVWHWVRHVGTETFKLDAGRHTIAIYNREDGIRLDQVLFAGYDPVNEYYPTGMEPGAPGIEENPGGE